MTNIEIVAMCDSQIAFYQKLKSDILRGDEWLTPKQAMNLTGWTERKLRWQADRNHVESRRNSSGDREYLRSSLLKKYHSENGECFMF